jgi:hypothetical protein
VWFHATGLLCKPCGDEYSTLTAAWKKKYRKQIDYLPFHVWANFLRKKRASQK